jgi:hypothetical protein
MVSGNEPARSPAQRLALRRFLDFFGEVLREARTF